MHLSFIWIHYFDNPLNKQYPLYQSCPKLSRWAEVNKNNIAFHSVSVQVAGVYRESNACKYKPWELSAHSAFCFISAVETLIVREDAFGALRCSPDSKRQRDRQPIVWPFFCASLSLSLCFSTLKAPSSVAYRLINTFSMLTDGENSH